MTICVKEHESIHHKTWIQKQLPSDLGSKMEDARNDRETQKTQEIKTQNKEIRLNKN